jgi:tetratricopeptide (TPR) repeat protein
MFSDEAVRTETGKQCLRPTLSRREKGSRHQLQRTGDHPGALEIARAVAAQHPDSADAWWLVSFSAKSLGDYDDALIDLRETIRRVPSWAPGWVGYGAVLRMSGRIEEAKRALSHALTLDPRNASAHRELSLIFESTKEYDEQVKHLSALDDLGSATEEDLNKLGTAHYNNKRFAPAAHYYRRVASLGGQAYAYFNLGLAYEYNEAPQYLDAADAFRRALLHDPSFTRAEEGLARLAPRLLGAADDALRQGRAILKRGEYYRYYVSPFELLDIRRTDEVDPTYLRQRKKCSSAR